MIQLVSKTSRAISAVVTASSTPKHPAVLGRTGISKLLMMSQNFWPFPAAFSRRKDTVRRPGIAASMLWRRISGEGYPAVPRNSLDCRMVVLMFRAMSGRYKV